MLERDFSAYGLPKPGEVIHCPAHYRLLSHDEIIVRELVRLSFPWKRSSTLKGELRPIGWGMSLFGGDL
jgi:hypothetical protein